MRKALKIIGILVVLVVVVAFSAGAYVTNALPNIPVQTQLTVEATPERVARGAYLANSVCVCMDCHSTRDWTKFAGPMKDGSLGVGGERFDQTLNFPGSFVSKNITPFSLKNWSDGELYRAITSGVSKNGEPFFPVMPYPGYAKMATEDVYSIIAYLRSLPSIASEPEKSKADFPMSVIMHLIPKPAEPTPIPDEKNSVAYGAYLVNAAGCIECHTKSEKGKKVGEPFAGGFVFNMPDGSILRSTNITPDPSGIGAMTKEQFVARFRAYEKGHFDPPVVNHSKGEMQTVMPWTMYAGMSAKDLGSIFDYLRTVNPVSNVVERWVPLVAKK